jgi:hypothetical protein
LSQSGLHRASANLVWLSGDRPAVWNPLVLRHLGCRVVQLETCRYARSENWTAPLTAPFDDRLRPTRCPFFGVQRPCRLPRSPHSAGVAASRSPRSDRAIRCAYRCPSSAGCRNAGPGSGRRAVIPRPVPGS